ncbi:unnamed protein product [Phytophthora fragariaefolia]|uniref:Unnamed protein product n=1 Tax=Phytophthora fragariaefolia TaxID=1490495 RepID=A0A9W6XVX3_9STRA|nr:unnamed protein product [Phytophthora fragariaefolia]
MEEIEGEERLVRVGRMRAVQAPVIDTLPTAVVDVCGEQHRIKLDTGIQYSVAGEASMTLGERQDILPPVDYVEAFTATPLTGADTDNGSRWQGGRTDIESGGTDIEVTTARNIRYLDADDERRYDT